MDLLRSLAAPGSPHRFASACQNLGVLCLEAGGPDSAVTRLTQAIRAYHRLPVQGPVATDLADATVARGNARRQLGRTSDALADYSAALRLFRRTGRSAGDVATVQLNIGVALWGNGHRLGAWVRFPSAERCYRSSEPTVAPGLACCATPGARPSHSAGRMSRSGCSRKRWTGTTGSRLTTPSPGPMSGRGFCPIWDSLCSRLPPLIGPPPGRLGSLGP
ncbi:tetratricopeptide tpr_2 repeat protein : [Gemmata massiliana]|uniref:Tetratricopeptide tpr_2 repeat protein n=1 Tax=Gemmata massiliana TaxID=1210884 RepID=A0A6P2CSF7_9BACT|nr:tetratricopeptide repeat protein [Gemmata massiliana]VTR92028.1 tetratricopeptide tpr_2 repeat protein : [Gemmata massiliana]